MHIKKIAFTFTFMILCINATAQNNSGSPQNVKEIARKIAYEYGEKSAKIINAEIALDKHPMLSSALNGVVKSANHCVLYQFDSKKRPKDDIRSTQFNGGEIKIMFTYFCYRQEKIKNDEKSQVMADIVLNIEGDFSATDQVIFDPHISHSKCYSHYCGSN